MKLRIIAGKLKRRSINIPDSVSDFRPTKELVRESLLNSLSPRIRDAEVADICFGSGVFGLEMISRGAKRCDFIDNSRKRCRYLEKQILSLKLEPNELRIFCSDVTRYFNSKKSLYDIIFYDPPYGFENLADFVLKLCPFVKPGGILVYERGFKRENSIPDFPGNSMDVRRFGQTEVITWCKPIK